VSEKSFFEFICYCGRLVQHSKKNVILFLIVPFQNHWNFNKHHGEKISIGLLLCCCSNHINHTFSRYHSQSCQVWRCQGESFRRTLQILVFCARRPIGAHDQKLTK